MRSAESPASIRPRRSDARSTRSRRNQALRRVAFARAGRHRSQGTACATPADFETETAARHLNFCICSWLDLNSDSSGDRATSVFIFQTPVLLFQSPQPLTAPRRAWDSHPEKRNLRAIEERPEYVHRTQLRR